MCNWYIHKSALSDLWCFFQGSFGYIYEDYKGQNKINLYLESRMNF